MHPISSPLTRLATLLQGMMQQRALVFALQQHISFVISSILGYESFPSNQCSGTTFVGEAVMAEHVASDK